MKAKQLDLEEAIAKAAPEFSKMRSAYVPGHDQVVVDVGEVSMTRQEFAADADVNILMARYEKTGVWPYKPETEPQYLDLTGVPDFHEAMQLMVDADRAFMSLPAATRKEFDNDPGKFVEFAADPENVGKMREWGLAAPEKLPDAPQRVEVVNYPAPDDYEPGGVSLPSDGKSPKVEPAAPPRRGK